MRGCLLGPAVRDQKVWERNEIAFEIMRRVPASPSAMARQEGDWLRAPAVRDRPAREELELASEIMGPVNWGCGGGERTGWGIMGPVNLEKVDG